MHSQPVRLNRLSARLGFWAALVCVGAFVGFTVCFVAVALTNRPFTWTGISDYIAFTSKYEQGYKYAAQLLMLVFAVAFIVLLGSIQDYAPAGKKPLARLGAYFGIVFAALVGIHYFVQVTTVRLALDKGQVDGLAQFIQSNPTSAIAAINMLGWTVFLGIASLCLAPVFSGSRLEDWIRWSFLLNGLNSLLGGLGFGFDVWSVVLVTMNFGLGLFVLSATVALALLFRRHERATRRAEVIGAGDPAFGRSAE